MNQISGIVSIALKELLPLSVFNEVACFVFYDDHPRDDRSLDVTICTNKGVVQEFFQKELLDSVHIENFTNADEIKILRNNKCELFYLVAGRNEIVILSKKEKLQLHMRINNVHTYELEDPEGRGQASLKIVLRDDAVPLVFDDNFVNLREKSLSIGCDTSEASLPVVVQLMRKLNEAKYTKKSNENALKECLKLRQRAACSIYQLGDTDLDKSVFKISQREISYALKIKTQAPTVKCCNKKIVIITSLFNKNVVPLTDVTVLLHGTTNQSLVYTTKVFDQIPMPPFWKENNSQIDNMKDLFVVTVVDLKEIRDNTMSRIEFDAVVSFKKESKTCLLPLGNIKISAEDIMGKNFDILSNNEEDRGILMLAILATSEKTSLTLRHIKKPGDNIITPNEIFCTHLKMDTFGWNNIAIHKISPHHTLYGVLVVFQNNIDGPDHVMNVQVYSRSYSQVLALIYYMYQLVPYTIIATTPDYKLTAVSQDLIKYNEKSDETETQLNYTECASSLLKQSNMLKEFFNNCVIKMSESKNTAINQVDFEIDLIAQGLPKYLEFRNSFLEESLNGVKTISFLKKPVTLCDIDSEGAMSE